MYKRQGYSWDEAWHIVTNTVCYTNHTVLAEALERWPQNLIESLLPRIWEILKEIAARYQRQLEGYFGGDMNRVSRMAIIWGGAVSYTHLDVYKRQSLVISTTGTPTPTL